MSLVCSRRDASCLSHRCSIFLLRLPIRRLRRRRRHYSVGFDFDYTLVTYTDELLELIYEKALARLITDRQYPTEMAESGLLKYDPLFSIRGLAVDKVS